MLASPGSKTRQPSIGCSPASWCLSQMTRWRTRRTKRGRGRAFPRLIESLEVHLGLDFAPTVYLVLRPPGEAGHDRQSTPCTAYGVDRAYLRRRAGVSGIAHTEGQSVINELEFQFESVALAASVTDRVRNEFARHEQSVLHALPVDSAAAECAA